MKKRLRWGEFLTEKAIAGTAFLSLGFIALIFVFVFREAAPVFFTKAPSHVSEGTAGGEVGAAESYGEVGPSESYGGGDEVGPSDSYGEPEGDSASTAATADSSSSDSATAAAPPSDGEGPALHHEDGYLAEKEASGSIFANLLSLSWQPVSLEPKFGMLPLVVGSLKVSLLALLIAAPIGILAALYTSTFAPRWGRELMKPVIEILAGFPSVVIGFFALVVIASLVQNLFGLEYRLNALVGGIAMSLAVIPLIYTISEDSLAAVPKAYTEGSLALGATKWETYLKVVLPAATPGIFAAILLGLGRAFGETMIVLMATGNAALLSLHIAEPVRTVSASIGAEMAEVVFGETHYHVLFLLGAFLFLFSFTLNAVAEVFVRDRLMRKFGGGK